MDILIAIAVISIGCAGAYALYRAGKKSGTTQVTNNTVAPLSSARVKGSDYDAPKANEKIDSRRVASNPDVINPGATVWLSEKGDSFEVQSVERHDSGDDEWVEFKLVDPLGAHEDIFLSAEQDDEDRWVWSLNEKVPLLEINGFVGLKYKGDKKPPTTNFSFRGKTWCYDDDEYNFNVTVTDRLIDRPETSTWKARVTEYYNQNNEDEVIALELWDGGGFVTIGEPYKGTVEFLSA